MAEHTITIKNCNNIRKADISLSEGTLNIKFGYNGTGKSTISEAIRLKMEEMDLSELTPFWAMDAEADNAPSVGDIPFHKVKVLMINTFSNTCLSPMGSLKILIACYSDRKNAMN